MGGGLQMMFGVMGNRWEEREYWKDIMKKTQSPVYTTEWR